MNELELPKDFDEYKIVDADVKLFCSKCKKDVSIDDAVVMVSNCVIDEKKKQVIQIPNRAFHFNILNNITCNGELEIRE